jgi:hypothetical protein
MHGPRVWALRQMAESAQATYRPHLCPGRSEMEEWE